MNKQFKYLWYLLLLIPFFVLSQTEVQLPEVEVQQGWLPIVALGASVLGSVIQGASQRRQARQLESQNQRPVYTQDPHLAQNRAIAQQMSRVGLPEQVYNNQLQQIQQNLSTGLRTINQRGNVAYNANSLVRGTNQATSNLNALDAQARQQNQRTLMQANQALAGDRRFGYQTEMQAYQQNAQNIASLRRAGNQNMWSGFGMLAQGAMMGVFNGGGTNNLINQPTTINRQLPINGIYGNSLGGGIYA